MAKPEKSSKGPAKEAAKEKPAKAPKKELSIKERQAKIAELLAELRDTDDPTEKRKIRARLRNLGHWGGLGERVKKDADAKGGKKADKKASKKSRRDEDEDDEDVEDVEDEDESDDADEDEDDDAEE